MSKNITRRSLLKIGTLATTGITLFLNTTFSIMRSEVSKIVRVAIVGTVSLNYKITDRRSGDVEKVYADTTISNKRLNRKATKSIEEMLFSAWNWQLKLKKKKNYETNIINTCCRNGQPFWGVKTS